MSSLLFNNLFKFFLNKFSFFISLLIITHSCITPTSEERFDKERDKAVYGALKKFIKSMEAKGYRAAGIGEGLDHSIEKQNYLGITFTVESLPDVNFARKIEMETLEELLRYINAEEGIQDYVAEYPFPLKFVHIAFISQHRDTGLFSVANFRHEISYNQDEPNKPMGPSIEIHSESYEDAVRVLAQQKNFLERNR